MTFVEGEEGEGEKGEEEEEEEDEGENKSNKESLDAVIPPQIKKIVDIRVLNTFMTDK